MRFPAPCGGTATELGHSIPPVRVHAPHPTVRASIRRRKVSHHVRAKPGETRVDRHTAEVLPRRAEAARICISRLAAKPSGDQVPPARRPRRGAARSDDPDISFVPQGGEAQVARTASHAWHRSFPAPRRSSTTPLCRRAPPAHPSELGLIPVNRCRRREGGFEEPAPRQGPRVSKPPTSTRRNPAWRQRDHRAAHARNGAIGLTEMRDGEPEFIELRRIRTHRSRTREALPLLQRLRTAGVPRRAVRSPFGCHGTRLTRRVDSTGPRTSSNPPG